MRKNYLISLLALSAMAVSASSMAKENVTVSGSTTVLPVMQKISEHLMQKDPSIVIELSGGGSGNGIKALNEQLTQIAMSSRKIKDKEMKAAEEKGVKPFEIPVAVDAIVPIVNPKNSLKNLSLDDLRKIYKGEIKNWKEVGGPDAPIVLVSRDTSSGTFETWESLVMKNQRVSPRALLQSSNGTVVQTVSRNPNAIGYVGLGYVVPIIKAVEINGIKATPETAKNGKWPLSRDLYLYTNHQPQGAVKKVTDFCLSEEGRSLIKEVGFIPPAKRQFQISLTESLKIEVSFPTVSVIFAVTGTE